MIINTSSAGISLAKQLETDSAAYYEALAGKFPKNAETFLSYAKENKKNIANNERVYFGVITDAIEGCYAYNLNSDDYALDTRLAADAAEADAVAKAVKLEETIASFYKDAAEQGGALMADVTRAFTLAVKKRARRIENLKSL
ncbi:MAG: hypothetical protein JXA46_12025 [Dehalococcoidales bacterium]|nr:hypothetical protein [Dehalococcoidales bacterium]